jgi:hypothetical protein
VIVKFVVLEAVNKNTVSPPLSDLRVIVVAVAEQYNPIDPSDPFTTAAMLVQTLLNMAVPLAVSDMFIPRVIVASAVPDAVKV